MEKAEILLIEDEAIVAIDLQRRLRNLGHSVPGYWASGEEAVAKTGELRPDLVLMDIKLDGDMDGVEAAAHIRDRFATPVIYLTANSDEATLQRAKYTEPFGFLLKPYIERDLATTIELALHRRRAEQKQQWNEALKKAIVETAMDCIIAFDQEGRIVDFNPAAERVFGCSRRDALGEFIIDLIVPPGRRDSHWRALTNHLLTGQSSRFGYRLDITALRSDGSEFPAELAITRFEVESRPVFTAYLRDITERKRDEAEMEKLVAGLQAALASGKTLAGLLPICAGCKKIRDDRGSWNQLEQYLSSRTQATFTHGWCPDCANGVLKDLARYTGRAVPPLCSRPKPGAPPPAR